jgi:co-chaperonin GroES (HSP10)
MLRAANNWIILERNKNVKEEKVGSIAIVNSDAEAKQCSGTVVTVGPDVTTPMKPGDTVYWGQWDGGQLIINKKRYVNIRETDVVAVDD